MAIDRETFLKGIIAALILDQGCTAESAIADIYEARIATKDELALVVTSEQFTAAKLILRQRQQQRRKRRG